MRETKAANLAWQVRGGAIEEGLQALQPPSCRHAKLVSEVVCQQAGTKIKGLNEIDNNLLKLQVGVKWHAKEIQGCEDLLQDR